MVPIKEPLLVIRRTGPPPPSVSYWVYSYKNVSKWRKFYLMICLVHFIYSYMVKDHSDSEREKLLLLVIRSGESVYHERSEQAVVAHACHGHRYWPSLVPLSGTVKKKGRMEWGRTACTGRYKRVQVVRPWSVAYRGCLSVIRDKVIFYMHHIKNILHYHWKRTKIHSYGYGIKHMANDLSDNKRKFNLTMRSVHFICGYLASGAWSTLSD